MTFDLDLWRTDLNINRDHLLIKDYLPTKFEACGAKRSWVINCTRWSRLAWPLTLTFDVLTWISIGIIYSSRTIYLPSLKLVGQSVLELSIRNIATNITSMFTRTCRLFSIVVMSSKYVGNFDHRNNLPWSFEQVFLWFTESSKPNKHS